MTTQETTASDTVRRLKEDGRGLAGDVREQAESFAETQKARLAERVGGLAGSLRDTSTHLREHEEGAVAGFAETAARQLDRVSRVLREKDMRTMYDEASSLARSHPAMFLGGAVALGFLAGRFLRASDGSDDDRGGRWDPESSQAGEPHATTPGL